MDDMTRADWLNEAHGPTFDADEYEMFLSWQEMATSLLAIGRAAGRSEVLKLQRTINADVWDAKSRQGDWILSNWAEPYALDLQQDMVFAVDAMVSGTMPEALSLIDSMRDPLTKAMDRAQGEGR